MKGYVLRPSREGELPSYDVTMEDEVITVPVELLKWLSQQSGYVDNSDIELLEAAARLVRQEGIDFWMEEIKK